jgi:archaemetzincin
LTINLEEDEFLPLTKDLGEIFKRRVNIERYDLDISFSYNQKRAQFHSGSILDRLIFLLRGKIKKEDIILGILDVDLYTEGLNFIFGEALPVDKIAIISIKRLRQEYYGLSEDKNLFYQRTLKEAVHEIGHIFGLSHCPNPKCVMHFSNSLLDTDMKDFRFCPICERKIK